MLHYNYQSDDPRDYGFVHEKDLPCFDETRWYIERAYKAIQTNDLKELTECLGELGHQFDVELKPQGEKP